jgi:hypothetical protein
MELQIKKNEGKQHIILYRRNDGSSTWMHADNYFVVHDLSHFVIEKMLGYKTAFMGMLNNGMGIHDFENREKRKQIAVIGEAIYAENMANIFLMETAQGNLEDLNKVLQDSFKPMNSKLAAPILSDNQISSIRNYLRQLIKQWEELPAGEMMNLIFEL